MKTSLNGCLNGVSQLPLQKSAQAIVGDREETLWAQLCTLHLQRLLIQNRALLLLKAVTSVPSCFGEPLAVTHRIFNSCFSARRYSRIRNTVAAPELPLGFSCLSGFLTLPILLSGGADSRTSLLPPGSKS